MYMLVSHLASTRIVTIASLWESYMSVIRLAASRIVTVASLWECYMSVSCLATTDIVTVASLWECYMCSFFCLSLLLMGWEGAVAAWFHVENNLDDRINIWSRIYPTNYCCQPRQIACVMNFFPSLRSKSDRARVA